jgi:hypothetical protein
MATNDTELKQEVRVLTDYNINVISDTELQSVVDLTRRELLANIGDETLDLYGTISSERAFFWLTCIFAKVKSGEIDASSFSIGELDVKASEYTGKTDVWMDNFRRHYRAMEGGAPVAHTVSNRSDRTYDFDNSATDNNL